MRHFTPSEGTVLTERTCTNCTQTVCVDQFKLKDDKCFIDNTHEEFIQNAEIINTTKEK